jgi:hypothetical protein
MRFPTGSDANTFYANDDDSTAAVNLGFSVDFFGALSSTVFVNNNGNVTFTDPLGQYTPDGLATGIGQPIIAPFFADVDTRGVAGGDNPVDSALVTYGTGMISDASLGWNNNNVFAVEWPLVGYYGGHTDKLNNFELLLVDRSDIAAGDFDIEFNYAQMQWETGDASGGSEGLGGVSAVAGYSNGMSGADNVYYQLAGSLVNGALIDGGPNALVSNELNSSVPGRYDFQVRNGAVIPPPSETPEPGTWLTLVGGIAGLALLRRSRNA